MGKKRSIRTQAIRTGHERTNMREHSQPIFATSSFAFESAAQAAALFADEESGFIYSRFTNPTVDAFTERLAAMEMTDEAVATATGMSAITTLMLSTLRAGDHMVCSRDVFGTTRVLINTLIPALGIDVSVVPLCDVDAWRSAMTDKTRLLFLETPSNPLGETADIAQMAQLAHDYGALLAVDNCFCTPILQRPITLGADFTVHSATKYIDGQGRCMAGAVAGAREVMGPLHKFLRVAGPSLSPFNAWIMAKSLETLDMRMRAHCEGAMQIAQWLEQQNAIEKVYYTGLEAHPYHKIAARQQDDFGGVVAFEVKGGRDAAWRCIDNAGMLSITANLGDAKTTIVHPATTTHSGLSEPEKIEAGIVPGLVRLAVGLESPDDIIADLEEALAASQAG